MTTSKPREATAYLQIVPGLLPGDAKVVGATQRRPEMTRSGAVIVKVRLRIPDAAFRPLEPSAVVEIPESLVQHPVTVEPVESEATP